MNNIDELTINMLGPQIEQPSESSAYPPVHTHSDDTPHDDNDFVPEPGMYLCFLDKSNICYMGYTYFSYKDTKILSYNYIIKLIFRLFEIKRLRR